MNQRFDLSLILPCYNEAGLFVESLEKILAVLNGTTLVYEIIFVDDASSDDTPVIIARFLKKKHKRGAFRMIQHATNQGRGKTVSDGIKVAKGRVVGYIDIDCEVDPVYIPRMVTIIADKKADVVIGKRYYRTTPKAIIREVLSRGYQWIAHWMIGTGKLDTETGYKFFARKKILPILQQATHPGWFWDTEVMVYSRRAGLYIVEVPVLFLRRFDKVSSVNVVNDTLDYIVQLWRFRKSLT